jgi:hypothetical protein
MWDAASTTAALTTAFASVGTVLLYAIGVILAAWAGLIGLGFGIRKAKQYITGKKF